MQESLTGHGFEMISMRLSRMRKKILRIILATVEDRRFKAKVDTDKEKEQNEKAEMFASELLDFIFQDIPGFLRELNPTKEQLKLFYFLKEATEDQALGTINQLTLDDTHQGIYKPTGETFLRKHYKAGSIRPLTDDLSESFMYERQRRFASFGSNWSVDRDYPMTTSFFGYIGSEDAKAIRLMYFEETPTKEQILKVIGTNPSETITADLYDAGKRIIVRIESEYKGKSYLTVQQYYLLGGFEGLDTKKSFLVYGTNEANQEMKKVQKQSVAVRQTALATAGM